MRVKLTQVFVLGLEFDRVPVRFDASRQVIYEPNTKNKTYVVYDVHRAAPVGFGVRISPKSKIYFVQRRVNNRVVKYKIGNVSDFSKPEEAHLIARQLLNNEMRDIGIKKPANESEQKVAPQKTTNEILFSKINYKLSSATIRSELDKLADGTVLDSVLAAAYLGISIRTLARMRSKGTAPPSFQYITNDIFSSNRRVFYKVGDLRKYMDKQSL